MPRTKNRSRAETARTTRIQDILDDLVRQRQALRSEDEHDRPLLEANRRSIVYWQTELAQALLDEHRDGPRRRG